MKYLDGGRNGIGSNSNRINCSGYSIPGHSDSKWVLYVSELLAEGGEHLDRAAIQRPQNAVAQYVA
jgi:hypothetical protein